MPIYSNISTATYRYYKTGDKNRKVGGKYRRNSPYVCRMSRSTAPEPGMPNYLTPTSTYLYTTTIDQAVINRLYGKLREKLIGNRGELLTSTVEWKTSLDMISGRVRTIHGAYLAVRRFQFKKAARILSIKAPARYKNLTKAKAQKEKLSPTSIWLEYWMGWAPLCGDIAHAVKTITSVPEYSKKHFSVGVLANIKDGRTYAGDPKDPSAYATYIRLDYTKKTRYSAFGDVMVINHNYDIANKLGFTNPALTAWQLVPFSFIVDWFANVGTVLGSLTDFEGLSFSNTGTAYKIECTASQRGYEWRNGARRRVNQTGFSVLQARTPGDLPTPRLEVKMLDKLSLTRAATSVSLLKEIFLRK